MRFSACAVHTNFVRYGLDFALYYVAGLQLQKVMFIAAQCIKVRKIQGLSVILSCRSSLHPLLLNAGETGSLGFFSDVTLVQPYVWEGGNLTTRPVNSLAQAPEEDPDNPGTPLFLSGDDEWFVAVQQVCACLRDSIAHVSVNRLHQHS